MNEESLRRILSRCLDQMVAGQSADACLAQHPEHARELEPLLAAAVEMGALRDYAISTAARQHMRAQIIKAEVRRNQQKAVPWWRWPAIALAMPRLAMGLIVAVFCVVLSSAIVAASGPGDLAYGMRVAVERVPALLTRDPEARARAELGIAERRLADLDHTRRSQAEAFDERTVAALLVSAGDAAVLAAGLPDAPRAEISARLIAQAERVARLGDASASEAGQVMLQSAARQMMGAAERARGPEPAPRPPVVEPGSTSAPEPTPTPTPALRQPTRQPAAQFATRRPAATSTMRATHTATPLRSDLNASATPKRTSPKATAQRPSLSATPARSGPSATPQSPGPSATPQGPGPNATPQGPGPEATPQGPGPEATPLAPGPESTPQGPGPEATPQGPGLEATPQGPGPEATSQGPGPGSTPGGPGSNDTPRGSRETS